MKTAEEKEKMGEKRRFKLNRGEFNGRFADQRPSRETDDNNDYDTQYAALRNKHFEFERLMARKMRNQTADRAPRREHGEREGRNYGRKSGDFGGKFERREGRFNRGEGKFGQRDSRGFKGGQRGERPAGGKWNSRGHRD